MLLGPPSTGRVPMTCSFFPSRFTEKSCHAAPSLGLVWRTQSRSAPSPENVQIALVKPGPKSRGGVLPSGATSLIAPSL